MGHGPIRTNLPSNSSGMRPRVLSSMAVVSRNTGPKFPRRYGFSLDGGCNALGTGGDISPGTYLAFWSAVLVSFVLGIWHSFARPALHLVARRRAKPDIERPNSHGRGFTHWLQPEGVLDSQAGAQDGD